MYLILNIQNQVKTKKRRNGKAGKSVLISSEGQKDRRTIFERRKMNILADSDLHQNMRETETWSTLGNGI
jgi:hypothetical protein